MVSIVGSQPVREAAERYRDVTFPLKLPPEGSPREAYGANMKEYNTEKSRLRQAFLDAIRTELGVTVT